MPLPRTVIAPPEWIAAQHHAEWLTAEEMAVLASWRSDVRRTEWLAGRLAAKRLMQEECSVHPLNWAVGKAGTAPIMTGFLLPNLALSLSHSNGLGAATVSDTRSEGTAGIDVQRIRLVRPGLSARVLSPNERAQIEAEFGDADDLAGTLLLWSLKEAAIKARRQPWGRTLQSIAIKLTGSATAAISLPDEPSLSASYTRIGDWWLARAVQPLHG